MTLKWKITEVYPCYDQGIPNVNQIWQATKNRLARHLETCHPGGDPPSWVQLGGFSCLAVADLSLCPCG